MRRDRRSPAISVDKPMETILLADDERIFKAVEGTCLRRERCRLLKAPAERLLESAKSRRPDLLVTFTSDDRSREALRRLCSEESLATVPIVVLDFPPGGRRAAASRSVRIKEPVRVGAVERVAGGAFRLDSRLDAAIKKSLPILDRASDRVDLSIAVRCQAERAAFTVRTKNISPSGLFLKTDRPLPRGRRFSISFSLPAVEEGARRALPDGAPVRIRGVCEVVRHVMTGERGEYDDLIPGMGVRFIEIDPETRSRLAKFVHVGTRPGRIGRRAPGAHSTH